MSAPEDLSEAEQQALHELQLAVEHVHRGFGALLECHHEIGNGMDHLEEARSLLVDAGHEEYAAELRDDVLPAGVFDDNWTYELVEAFREGFLADVDEFEGNVRAELADGKGHISEREMQRKWLERADRDD